MKLLLFCVLPLPYQNNPYLFYTLPNKQRTFLKNKILGGFGLTHLGKGGTKLLNKVVARERVIALDQQNDILKTEIDNLISEIDNLQKKLNRTKRASSKQKLENEINKLKEDINKKLEYINRGRDVDGVDRKGEE